MYLNFYGLKEKPFSLTPDPQFLYLSENHRTAIDSLLYGIHQREGFMVVTGDIGTGKTTVCRALLERLDRKVKTAVIFNSFLTEGELLRAILQDLGLASIGRTKTERINELNQFLFQQLSEDGHVILIIDEAQNLSIPVLEQIRMLSNLETTKEKMLQIILFGQLELNQKLRSAKLRQLNQRIAIRHHILPLNREETESYIYQRLTVAGSHGSITFSKSALDEIYWFTKGTPRLINLLCDRALISGFVDETHHIEKGDVKKAEKELGGKQWVMPVYPARNWSKYFPFLRISLLAILVFILFAMILLNPYQLSLLQGTNHSIVRKVENIYLRISGKPYSSSPIPAISEAQQEPLQNKTSKGANLTDMEDIR